MTPRPRPARQTLAPRARALAQHALALLGYVLLTLLYMRPAARVLATHLAPDPGDPLFNLVVLKWGIRQWQMGLPDFWNMPFFFPAHQVATYSDHLLGPSALAALFTAIVPNALAAYNLMFLGSFALSGWSTWFVLRRCGLAMPAAFLGGCMFAFSPFRWDQMSHVQVLLTQWIPLTLWSWDRLLAAPGWRRALAFLPLYLLHVTGGTYLAYMIHIPMAIQFLCRLPALWRQQRPAAVRVLIPTGMLCAVVLFVLFRPYLAESHEKKRSRSEVQVYSASLPSYLTPSDRNLYGVLRPEVLHRAENVLFPGIMVSVLAIAAALRLRRERGTTASTLAGLARPKQVALFALGLLAAVAWFDGELRTWILSGGLEISRVPKRLLVTIALAVVVPALAIAWRPRRAFAQLGLGALVALAAVWGVFRWCRIPLSTLTTYRLGMTVICAGLLAWFLWRRWTPGARRFLPTLEPWRRGLLISGVACFLLSFPMVYLPMMKFVPGLSGMRVPARFFPFISFPLVVLAAGELDRRWRATRPDRRRTFVTVATALVLLEVAPLPINWEPLPSEAELAPVYHWLARQPAVDGVLELPISDDTTDISYMYAMTLHWKPLVNGYSGYIADHYSTLKTTCCFPLPDAEQLRALRDWGVTHVLLHTKWLDKRWERKRAIAWAAEPGIRVEYEDPTSRVYRIAPSKVHRDG